MMKKMLFPAVLFLSAAFLWGAGEEKKSWAGSIPAPEFPADLEWINVPGPVTMESLKGKIVLLDFWTYGCINCIHNLPFVKKLREEFASELVVLGVHSAKFENEGRSDNLRNIVRRYDITYPVVNDGGFAVWQLWGPKAWPTLVLVDPDGKVVGGKSGEGFYETFREIIQSLKEEFGAEGKINRKPLSLKTETRASTVLSFPGKIRVDPEGDRLFLADSGNHRIIAVETSSGTILDAAGGSPGFRDGSFEEARFRNPQGLALARDGKTLYVADTENHAIRALDLAARRVVTIAGTGKQAEAYPPEPGTGTAAALSSPWDLVLRDDLLYVAMAGSHQLWTLRLSTGRAEPFAGSGAEGFLDAPAAEAELAQPSGLSLAPDGRLYFADSEGSTVRWAETAAKEAAVKTLAGSGKSLFEFGKRDGIGTEALLQHPLGVVYYAGSVYVADTYNHAIRKIDPATGAVSTLAGEAGGFENGRKPRFNEPGGIDAARNKLYIADTNNHTIRVMDLSSGETTNLVLKGMEKFGSSAPGRQGAKVVLKTAEAGPGRGEIRLNFDLPKGFKPNGEAPSSFSVSASGTGVKFLGAREITAAGPKLPVVFPVELTPGEGTLTIEISLVYCEAEKESLCYLERKLLEIPYRLGGGSPSSIDVVHKVSPAEPEPRGPAPLY